MKEVNGIKDPFKSLILVYSVSGSSCLCIAYVAL